MRKTTLEQAKKYVFSLLGYTYNEFIDSFTLR